MDRASPDMIPRYHQALDFDALWREFPPADDYFNGPYQRPPDVIREIQNERFLWQMKRAWKVPFYRRHWKAAGMEPGDIRSVDDLARNPAVFRSRSESGSWRNEPFWADYIGIDPRRTSRCR